MYGTTSSPKSGEGREDEVVYGRSKIFLSLCKLLQSTSPKSLYFPYKVVGARALIASRVAQFLLKIAQHVLNMGLRGPHAYLRLP